MLNIQGAIQVIPEAISVEPGKLNADGNEMRAVIASFNSGLGIVQIVLPSDSVQEIVDSILEAKKKAEEESSNIYIPQGGMQEAEQIAKAKDNIEKDLK